MKWLLILFVVVAGSCGDILCAKGMATGGELTGFNPSGIGRIIRHIISRRLVILGWICNAVGFFSLLGLLSVAELSVAVPATALGFVLDTIGARFFLHEHVHWKRWVGVLFVAGGVLLAVDSGGSHPLGGPRAPAPATMHAHQH